MIPKYTIIHHSAISRRKLREQFDAIDKAHRAKGWGKIGYHFLIEGDGEIKTGRALNESGAHTKGMNHKSIGICLAGNMEIERLTSRQLRSLSGLILGLKTMFYIPHENILGHRQFAKTLCPGKNLTDKMIDELIITKKGRRYLELAVKYLGRAWHEANKETKDDIHNIANRIRSI